MITTNASAQHFGVHCFWEPNSRSFQWALFSGVVLERTPHSQDAPRSTVTVVTVHSTSSASFPGFWGNTLFFWGREMGFEKESAVSPSINLLHGQVSSASTWLMLVEKNIAFWKVYWTATNRTRNHIVTCYYNLGGDEAVWQRTHGERILLKAMVT